MNNNDEFTLYDLKVEVKRGSNDFVCNHHEGDSFVLSGEELSLPPNQTFSIYALAALLPLLPAKQRDSDPNDWMTTDMNVACPDPNCGAIFHISRIGKKVFKHSEVTKVVI